MKLTNRKIIDSTVTLSYLSQKQLPVKISYALSKNINKIENELKVYNFERKKLLDKYCIKDEEGKNKIDENNQLKIKDEHLKDWDKEINELLDIEVEIDIHKFKESDLMCCNFEISPSELMLIDYMIEG